MGGDSEDWDGYPWATGRLPAYGIQAGNEGFFGIRRTLESAYTSAKATRPPVLPPLEKSSCRVFAAAFTVLVQRSAIVDF